MDIKQRPLDDLTSLDLINIADKIVLSQNWPTLGLHFEKSHKFVITKANLVAKFGAHQPDQELCRRLLDELAEKGITIGELDKALRDMSLISTANSVQGIVNASLAPVNQPGSTAPEKKDISKPFEHFQTFLLDLIFSDFQPSKKCTLICRSIEITLKIPILRYLLLS
jgi:hypothetical protein